MAEKSRQPGDSTAERPRVIADFGGRRKILDRRYPQSTQHMPERRSGTDRRSGFDRRGAIAQNRTTIPEKRHGLANEDASKAKSAPDTE